MDVSEHIQYIRSNYSSGCSSTLEAMNALKENNNELALHYFSLANTSFGIVDVFIHVNHEFHRSSFDKSYSKFKLVYEELIECLRNNHSFQHVWIYYEEFINSLYENFGHLNIDINMDI
ncbi:hypothetical protein RW115_01165 [Macrococcus capreoli]